MRFGYSNTTVYEKPYDQLKIVRVLGTLAVETKLVRKT